MAATTYTSNSYQQTDILTASPMQLIIMLYDECLKSLDKAVAAFQVDDPSRIATIGSNLLHAQNIVTELAISLDMENGGEIAHNLHRLYDFALNHLSQANVQQNVQPIHEVITMLSELRDAWTQVAQHEVKSEVARPTATGKSTFRITG